MITTTQISVTSIGSRDARLSDEIGFGMPQSSRRDAVSVSQGQVLVDRRVPAGQAHQVAHRIGLADDVVSGDGRRAGIWPQERRQDPDGRS